MVKNKNVSAQNDGFDPLMNGGETVRNDEGTADGEDIRNEISGENHEAEGGDKSGEDQESGGENQETGKGTENGEDQESEPVPQILTAVYPILYLSHQYRVGEELPANDPEMVKAWVAAGTAVWMPAMVPATKAKPRTAEPGLPGQVASSESEDGDNLAGKVPKTGARKR